MLLPVETEQRINAAAMYKEELKEKQEVKDGYAWVKT